MMYTDISASREVRREKLRRLYGFDCECTYCDLPDKKAVAHSDLSRAKLRDWPHINPGYLKWSTDLCRADDVIIKSHQEALALIEQEGMYALRCLYMEEIMLSYALLGEEAQFRDWAQKLLNLCAFQDPALAADVRTWLKNPRLMKKWAWRKKHRLREHGMPSSAVHKIDSVCSRNGKSKTQDPFAPFPGTDIDLLTTGRMILINQPRPQRRVAPSLRLRDSLIFAGTTQDVSVASS